MRAVGSKPEDQRGKKKYIRVILFVIKYIKKDFFEPLWVPHKSATQKKHF